MPSTIISVTSNREQLYETFMGIYNPKTLGTRSQGFDFMRMLAVLAPSDLVLRDGLDALSLIQVGSTHADQRLLSESVVRYGKTLRGIQQALNGSAAVEDTVLTTVSVLAICEFFDHMKENQSAWLGHLGGFDQILLARGPKSLNTKLSMLSYYQSRFPALSRSLLRRKADPLSSPGWRAMLQKMPLGMSGEVMNLALQVPELLERYDALHASSAVETHQVENLLGDCESLDTEYSEWYAHLTQTLPVSETPCYTAANIDQFPTYCALIPDRTLTIGYLFSEQKYSFIHQQSWSSIYFLRTTISHLRDYLQQQSTEIVERSSKPPDAEIHSTPTNELDDIVFSLCRYIPGFAEPATGAHGHTAMFLPLRIATSHFHSRQLWDWARWAETVRARIFYRGIRPPAVKDGDYPEARPLV